MTDQPGPTITVKDKLEDKFRISVPVRILKKFASALNQRLISLHSLKLPRGTGTNVEDNEQCAILLYFYLLSQLWSNCKEVACCEKPDFEDKKQKTIRLLQLSYPIVKGALLFAAEIGYNGYVHRWFYLAEREDFAEWMKAYPGTPIINLTHKKVRTGDTPDQEFEGEFMTSWAISAGSAANKVLITGKVKSRCDAEETLITMDATVPAPPEEEDDIPEFVKVGPLTFVKGANGSPAPVGVDISSFQLPAPEQKGPVLQDTTKLDVKHEATKTSHCAFKIDPVEVTSGQDCSYGPTCNNYITMLMDAQNTSETKNMALSYRSVKAWYQDSKGNFVEPKKVSFGIAYPGWNSGYDYRFLEENLLLEPKVDVRIVVQLTIECEGPSGSTSNDRDRAHFTLPQPLVLKAELEEDGISGALHTIVMQQSNPPMTFATADEKAKDWGSSGPLKLWVAADDFDNRGSQDARAYCGVYVSENGEFTIRRYDGTYFTMVKEAWNEYAYDAKKKGVDKIEMENIAYSSGSTSVQAFALVDRAKNACYGVQVGITTATSFASGACHVEYEPGIKSQE